MSKHRPRPTIEEACPLEHTQCGACGHEIRQDGTCGCLDNRHPNGRLQETLLGAYADDVNRLQAERDELLAACVGLVDHRLLVRVQTNCGDGYVYWRCPHCEETAATDLNFPHAADCPVVQGRAAIAKARGNE